jgi:hypothetical protein
LAEIAKLTGEAPQEGSAENRWRKQTDERTGGQAGKDEPGDQSGPADDQGEPEPPSEV